MNNKSFLWVVLGIVVVVGGIAAVNYLNQPDDRDALQRLGDAAEELPDVDSAAGQLEDQTPAEKLGNAVEEATDGDGK